MNAFFSAPDGRGRGDLRRDAPRRTGASRAPLALVVALVVVLGLAAPPAVATPPAIVAPRAVAARAVAAPDAPRAGNPPAVATPPAIVTPPRVVPPAVTPLAVVPPAVFAVFADAPPSAVATRPAVAIPPAVAGARSRFLAEWSWPLSPEPRVLRRFERPPQRWKPGHRGVDLATADPPAVVGSPADGVVSFVGTVVDRGVLSIDHGDGRISSFEPVSSTLVKGQAVKRGDPVATVTPARPRGTGGPGRAHCGEGCLHWGVRVEGEYVDPLAFVTDRRPSVLLPFDGERPRPLIALSLRRSDLRRRRRPP